MVLCGSCPCLVEEDLRLIELGGPARAHTDGHVAGLGWEPASAAPAGPSSKSQRGSVLLKVSPQFLLCPTTASNSLVEFSRNLGLEVTSVVIRHLTNDQDSDILTVKRSHSGAQRAKWVTCENPRPGLRGLPLQPPPLPCTALPSPCSSSKPASGCCSLLREELAQRDEAAPSPGPSFPLCSRQ